MPLLAQTAAPFWDLKLVGGGVSGAADRAGPHGRPAHRRRGSRPESQGEAEPSGARGRPGGVDLSPSSLGRSAWKGRSRCGLERRPAGPVPASCPATLGACCRRQARGTIGLRQHPVRAADRGPELGSGHLGWGATRSAGRLCPKLLMLAASAEIPLQSPQEGSDLVWHFMVPPYTIAIILQGERIISSIL